MQSIRSFATVTIALVLGYAAGVLMCVDAYHLGQRRASGAVVAGPEFSCLPESPVPEARAVQVVGVLRRDATVRNAATDVSRAQVAELSQSISIASSHSAGSDLTNARKAEVAAAAQGSAGK